MNMNKREKIATIFARARWQPSGPKASDYRHADEVLKVVQDSEDAQPALTVWYGSMPESNGRENWTATIRRVNPTDKWDQGFCFAQSEYPDRVRYEADRMRWIIGELAEKPDILAYDAEKHSGYVTPSPAPNALPVPVTIFCPKCALPHVDEGKWATTRHHKTHQCQGCGHEWRPFPFATVGVTHPAPDALRVAVESLERIKAGRSSVTECSLIARQALAALQAEQGAK